MNNFIIVFIIIGLVVLGLFSIINMIMLSDICKELTTIRKENKKANKKVKAKIKTFMNYR